jgi:hypothetical protein
MLVTRCLAFYTKRKTLPASFEFFASYKEKRLWMII